MTARRRRELEDRLVKIEAIIGYTSSLQAAIDDRHPDIRPESWCLAEYCSREEARKLAAEWGQIRLQLTFPRMRIYAASRARLELIDAILDRMTRREPISVGGEFQQPFLKLVPDIST